MSNFLGSVQNFEGIIHVLSETDVKELKIIWE